MSLVLLVLGVSRRFGALSVFPPILLPSSHPRLLSLSSHLLVGFSSSLFFPSLFFLVFSCPSSPVFSMVFRGFLAPFPVVGTGPMGVAAPFFHPLPLLLLLVFFLPHLSHPFLFSSSLLSFSLVPFPLLLLLFSPLFPRL